MRSLFLFAFLNLALSQAFAGDASVYKVLGFSKDGKHFAFYQEGVGDGSGFDYVTTQVLEVATSKVVGSATVHDEKETMSDDELKEKSFKEAQVKKV